MTPEERKYQREYKRRLREEYPDLMRAKARAYYHRKRAAMTPEQLEAERAKDRARYRKRVEAKRGAKQ